MSKPLPADKYDPDTLMSYQEWKDCGRFVLKGMKSRCRDAVGVPQFSVDQVTDPVGDNEDRVYTRSYCDSLSSTQSSFRSHMFNFMDNTQHKHHSVNEIMDALHDDGTWGEPNY